MTEKYSMTLSLSVLEHLGLNLYSNVPAVLSEVVANAWDADAERVDITIDTARRRIVIKDDGSGMTQSDINDKYLFVGYHRRVDQGAVTPRFDRHVMGRKGIGKLSLFAIANTITLETKSKGQTNGFVMKTKDIKELITDREGTYAPTPLDPADVSVSKGTRLTLSDLRVAISAQTEAALRRRLARRFAILGSANKFRVFVNGTEVSLADRDYYKNVQYLWSIGDVGDRYEKLCLNADKTSRLSGDVDPTRGWKITGWVGTVDERRKLSDDMNTIPVLAWGKLIHEDLLPAANPAGVYSKYLIGEIHADFVDDDSMEDIATSDRQSLKETDARYQELLKFLRNDVLKSIGNNWRDWRRDSGMKKARTYPAIERWYARLGPDTQESAKTVFGAIEELPIETEEKRKELYKYGILAFEKLRLKDLLSEVEAITGADLELLGRVFGQLDELELVQYGEIAHGRVAVIQQLTTLVNKDEKERVIQKHLFNHLWLLDPSWERASTNKRIEERMEKEFDKIYRKNLTDEERKARFDIRYRTAAGKHIIIELKRYSAKPSTADLVKQLGLYRTALEKLLASKFPEDRSPIECIAVLGTIPGELKPEAVEKTLGGIGARTITYDVLITQALQSYEEYTTAHNEVQELTKVLDELESESPQLVEVKRTRQKKRRKQAP